MNPFEALAAQQMTAAAKRKHKQAERRQAKSVVMSDRDAPMKGTAMEEARDERNAQVARYRQWKADQRDELLHGPHGPQVAPLVKMLGALTIDGAGALVSTVLGSPFLKTVDPGTRHTILGMIADAIMKVRVRNGLSPFDDSIGDEPPTAFQIIRKHMMGV